MKKTGFYTNQFGFVALLFAITVIFSACTTTEEKPDEIAEAAPPSSTILEAAFLGNVDAVKEHIANGSDLNLKDAYGSTALSIAATFGKTEIALLLIDGGADLTTTSADGSTPLHTAAFLGRTEIVRALLDKNVNVAAQNNYGSTALESVSGPFADIKPIYDQLSKDLGPLGFKLDYEQVEAARPVIAKMIEEKGK